MKLSSALVALSSLNCIFSASARVSAEAKIAQAAEERQLQEDIPGHACFSDEDFTVYFKGKCDFDAFVERISLKTEENSRCVNSGKAEAMLLVGKFRERVLNTNHTGHHTHRCWTSY
jgi:hypothetical protein